jgi:DNA-nicking Smr family endonuclease
LNSKLSDKDKKDWQNFVLSKNKVQNKDSKIIKNKNKKEVIKTIDFHGFSLNNANKVIEELIVKFSEEGVNKIIVITGKGLRSKNTSNPYVSKDLSILRYSVPEFIQSRTNLMKIIKQIKEADIEDGGEGAFYIYLKNFKE